MVVPKDDVYDKRFDYFADLLELVLSKSDRSFRLTDVEVAPSPTIRNVMFLQQGRFDVIWMNTNINREKLLRPIRIPLYKGLIGWRLFLINADEQERFSQISDLEDLQALKAGLGYDWPDTEILSHAGFETRTSRDWAGILNLLTHNRIDYFPRGLIEVWEEFDKLDSGYIALNTPKDTHLTVESSIVLHYPAAFYMFVDQDNEELALALETGFEKAIQDGTFNTLFIRYFGKYVNRSNLANRRVLHIPNESLPTETPLQRSELWFNTKDIDMY